LKERHQHLSTTGSNFVMVNNPASMLIGSTSVPAGVQVLALGPNQAAEIVNSAPPSGSGVSTNFPNLSGTPLDRVIWDLALLTNPPGLWTNLISFGRFIGGFAKNGALYFTLTGVTAVTVNFQTLAAAIGVLSSQGGDTLLATLNSLVIQNLSAAASTIVITPGASDPLTLPNVLGGTTPSISLLQGDVHCEFSLAGKTVSAAACNLTFTPTAGGIISLAYGGA
jgi:hypothetical protein